MLLRSEPFAEVQTMEELLAIAYHMEQEACDNYTDLAKRMQREGRADLVPVFEQLAEEESHHLQNVVNWSERINGTRPDLANLQWKPADTFDDEGASAIAPELMGAYRSFSMAVRNEERAFLFWTYVAAQTDRSDLRLAAEQMAREELGHLTTLRAERRRAFHAERAQRTHSRTISLPELELRFSDLLQSLADRQQGRDSSNLGIAIEEARERAAMLADGQFDISPLLGNGVSPDVFGRAVPLCELLLDCYLDYAERLPREVERTRAQAFAGQLVACRSALREALQ